MYVYTYITRILWLQGKLKEDLIDPKWQLLNY